MQAEPIKVANSVIADSSVIGLLKNNANCTPKINASMIDIALTNNFLFIDINKILMNKKYYLSTESYYINYLGHKSIYNEIKKVL